MTMVVDYLRLLGDKIPIDETYKNVSLQNYKDAYEKDTNVINIAVDYIAQKCIEVPPQQQLAGDILFLDQGGNKLLGIDGGNGRIISAIIGRKIEVVSNDLKILRVFRWVKKQ
jgi:hypothetical protein